MLLTDQLGFRFAPPERRVWTVRALVAAVRTHVEREYSEYAKGKRFWALRDLWAS